jgi:mono/diheme cytochrome c family protein
MFVWMKKLANQKADSSPATGVEKINMEGIAQAASPEAMKQAVLWYQKQTPAAGHGNNQELITHGKELFLKGVPTEKVLPCITCHGQNAQGQGAATCYRWPERALDRKPTCQIQQGDHHTREMTMVTRDLNPDQAHAVALYLQSK